MSGNHALLMLPDDQRLHVQFSRYFHASTVAKLRHDIDSNRTGLVAFEIAAPISAPLIQVAMDRRSTYVPGFRVAIGHDWWAFQRPPPRPSWFQYSSVLVVPS